ncbi:MAG: hypothetical protein WC642_06450 [Nocardioides sp.]|jgi:hypothetical protein
MSIRIDDLTFNLSDLHQVTWENSASLLDCPGGGSDEGRLLFRLSVDGQMDVIYGDLGQTGDLAALDRAIAAMQHIRDGLADLYRGRNEPGRCLEQGDGGRCYGSHGHTDEHDFPSLAQARALMHARRPTPAAEAS